MRTDQGADAPAVLKSGLGLYPPSLLLAEQRRTFVGGFAKCFISQSETLVKSHLSK